MEKIKQVGCSKRVSGEQIWKEGLDCTKGAKRIERPTARFSGHEMTKADEKHC
jgi:hypothetical protein